MIYKVMANDTEYRFKDHSTAMSFAAIAKEHMVIEVKYPWQGKVTIELLEEEPESVEFVEVPEEVPENV